MRKLLVIIVCLLLTTCGIFEYYYLPQVPEASVEESDQYGAIIYLGQMAFSYATGYIIFYRIYVSSEDVSGRINTPELRSQISSSLASDYNFFVRFIDPADTASILRQNTFLDRFFFEVEFRNSSAANVNFLSGSAFSTPKYLYLEFPTSLDRPTARLENDKDPVSHDNNPVYLHRNLQRMLAFSPEPDGDLYFRNRPELNDPANVTTTKNRDVTGQVNTTPRFSYVSLYIAAKGSNPDDFSAIYSKPTHIGIFRLPDAN